MFDDIINLPHPVSKNHPQMSMMTRAAQFSPFAALRGYKDAIDETTARLADFEQPLSEVQQADLVRKVRWLLEHINEHPIVCIVYFVHDSTQKGGKLMQTRDNLKFIDEIDMVIVMKDNTRIPMACIKEIEGNVFNELQL